MCAILGVSKILGGYEMKNMVCWFEIPVADMERAVKFYERVFQVKLSPLSMPGMDMSVFPHEMGSKEYGAAGALVKRQCYTPSATGTIVYFSCEDCKMEEARVLEAGGKVFHSKFAIGENGFIAICQDSEGNTIGLHSRA